MANITPTDIQSDLEGLEINSSPSPSQEEPEDIPLAAPNVNRLPTELLMIILSFACNGSHKTPVNTSRVSAKWRAIVLKDSIAWTQVVILGGQKAVLALCGNGPYSTVSRITT